MPENILVVEYEPRYTERVRQALAGQPFTPTFAKDGEEAIRALEGAPPALIVVSSVVPKISTSELIRAIRGRGPLQRTPILLTVSGYNGKSPKADAQRVGASDILPKPYSETEFLARVQQMLGAAPAPDVPAAPVLSDDEARAKKKAASDVDKMLADTLAGVMPSRKTQPGAPASAAKPRPAGSDLDKMLQDTLSGLEKSARKTTTAGTMPRPATPPAPAPAPAPSPAPAPAPAPAKPVEAKPAPEELPDRVPASQPILHEPARAEEEEPTDGVKFGQYVLVEKIATGGMAEVWKARMRGVEGFQKIVAIKKILPHLSDNQEFIEMFVDEAKLAAQLNHNNIIHIYDLGKIQNSYYIAMEYIDGFDLKTILRRGEERGHPMNVELALFIASKVASALDYAHRKKDFEDREMGLVHRDVSPQNVLISEEGDIKLCDFGIAKAASKASHTQAGALKGKLQYMAPEQAWGKHIDRRSDIFALATVLFEMLTGRKLFTGDNEISILEQVREARVQPPSLHNDEVTPEIDRIVLKALQKDPDDRYQTAGEMAREIDAVLYTFRPTPTSADLAIYMHRLAAPEPEAPAVVEHEPEPVHQPLRPNVIVPSNVIAPAVIPAVISAPVAVPEPEPEPEPVVAVREEPAPPAAPMFGIEPEKKKKSPIGIIAAIIAGIAIIGGAIYFLTRKAEPAAPATATTPLVAASTATVPTETIAPVPTATDTAATATMAATSTTPAIDPNAVDAEVQKRIAAERARLEALARQQAAQQPPAATPAQRPAETRPAPAATATTAPQVAQQTPAATATQPTAQTPPPAQQQAAAQPAAEPQAVPAQPVVQRAREGDLIPTGTPGLVPPRLVRRAIISYPPVARAQKVEGTVITNVLVSETGQVLDVKILRGTARSGALNEAAEQAMRRSSFAPAMKDGVRVKSWLTVPVEFKL